MSEYRIALGPLIAQLTQEERDMVKIVADCILEYLSTELQGNVPLSTLTAHIVAYRMAEFQARELRKHEGTQQ